ncbi:hypothetical protein [Thalassotalea sp. PLHSN55]|uniref:hypothetical protein n=1 Tax=Thalassotalea sp. PLHSN55 TaxID=3435888 RepID=UPI003F864B83
MDIFTTQLTRVVPVPIRPQSLKVKALLKEAATGKLTDDPEHLENHDAYYIATDEEHGKEQNCSPSFKQYTKQGKKTEKEITTEIEDKEGDDKNPHLDIFV